MKTFVFWLLHGERQALKYSLFQQHDITSGQGSCARNGTTEDNAFYCGTGPQCNNFAGKTCWNPSGDTTAEDECTSSQWTCKVYIYIYLKRFLDLKILNYIKKKTELETGVGSCVGEKTRDVSAYYCGTGSQCNNFVGKTCWNAKGGAVASTACTSSEWQCKV